MPRHRNPAGIAVGKLILAIQKEWDQVIGEPDEALARMVMGRARTLLQASRTASIEGLLSGRSVAEYLDADWVERHPSVQSSIEMLVKELGANL